MINPNENVLYKINELEYDEYTNFGNNVKEIVLHNIQKAKELGDFYSLSYVDYYVVKDIYKFGILYHKLHKLR